MASCNTCGRHWTGARQVHCGACHRHCGGYSGFDAHQTLDGPEGNGCGPTVVYHDPADKGMEPVGDATGVTWRRRTNRIHPAQVAELP